ncbi:MAG: isoleucine--tRNA ligase, partial [Candidatus Atribacteria bacterium]|nr:isoleucine--tRNA ligase [Candidatus Atribacteria bacterium]
MFESLGKLSDLAKKEEEVLSFWRERKIFLQTLQLRKNSPRFIFYEGPPTTNGYPHAGHIIGRSIKDLIPRYKTMCGYYVPRKAGWDTHGLPVELEVEKGLGFSGKQDIENYGIDRFNEKCKESIGKYIKEWEKITERMGIWIDLDHPYITCSDDYIETLWWILKNLWERDLLYQGYKVLPYCSRCGTSLSSHEVAQGYRDVEDFSVYILFRVTDQPHTFFLVWTTTPWTLVANVALAVGEELPYVEIEEKSTGRRFVLNRERLPHLFAEDQYILIREMVGADLVGISYQPLMDFLHAENGYRVYAADFVSTEEGTGIVHIAPAFGEDDMRLAQWNALSILQPVKPDGTYVDDVIPWKGMWVKDADPLIIDFLKKSGKLFKKETCRHAYPFCWRCDTPLLYYAKRSWFIKTTAVKDLLLANNQRIHWHPEHIQNGRFGNFLENVVDWALSRERYWGTPLNIWICESCGFREAIGSKKELNERSREKLADIELHRPYVDQITLVCPECGGIMKRVPEVLDCWFDSGAMFVAQNHYPFENKETLDDTFPADFICEAIDQTRGWFYSLHVLASILFQSGAFRDCLVTELGLDEKGRKMSKHVGNVINPWELVSAYGADVLRWYVYSVSPPWVPKRFGKQSLGEVYSKFFTTLWNTVNFFVL